MMKIKLGKAVSILFAAGYGLIVLLGWPTSAQANEMPQASTSPALAEQKRQSFIPAVSVNLSNPQKSLITPIERLNNRKSAVNQNGSVTRRSVVKKDRSIDGKVSITGENKVLRAEFPQSSRSDFGFSFYGAWSYLNSDLDLDGFYSDFTIEFDADYDNGYAEVYAVIYYSENGGPWTELTVTDVFAIYSDDASDFQSITSVLNYGFPSSEYDILVDLYENGVDGIVATISSDDTDNLYALPLEDLEHENASNQISISYASSLLFNDFDNDGFFTDLTLEYDIATFYQDDVIYAEITLTDTITGQRQYLSSDDFILGNQTEFLDLTFNSGYFASWYDVRINLINAYTGEVIASVGAELESLRALPIESVNNDSYFDTVVVPLPAVDVSVAAGSFGWSFIFLGLLALRRPKSLAFVTRT